MPEVPGIPDKRSGFGGALAVGRKLDLPLPDTPAVRDAYAHAEAGSQPWLFNHVMRSWLYGAKLAQRRGLAPDAELVAVAVLLHDLGLARGGAPDRRFEVVGADIGRAFALSHDMGERRAEVVWDSIALHTTPSIAQHKGADVACCQNGIACDYGGLGYQELSDDIKKVILSAYPRLDMKNMLTTCLCGIAKTRVQQGTISSQTSASNTFQDIRACHRLTGYIKPPLPSRQTRRWREAELPEIRLKRAGAPAVKGRESCFHSAFRWPRLR